MNKKAVSYHSLVGVVFMALFVFGLYKVTTDENINTTLKAEILQQSSEKPLLTSVFLKSLDELTPTVSYKLPFTDAKILLINKFPVLDWVHILTMIILISLSGFFMNLFKVKKSWMLLTFLILIIVGYVIGTIILYITYMTTGKMLTFTTTELDTIQKQYNEGFDKIALPLIVLSFIALLSVGKVIFKRMR